MGARNNFCEVPLQIWVSGQLQPSYTAFLRPCAYAATLDTRIAGPDFRMHLNSDYLGDPERPTRSTHCSDSSEAVPVHAGWETVTHPSAELDVRWTPSDCLYDHLHRLLGLLQRLGHAARMEVSDETVGLFEGLARGLGASGGRPGANALRSEFPPILCLWTPLGSAG